MAELLVSYSIAVKPGDKVAIRSWTGAAPLLNELYAAILRAGGYPLLALKLPETDEILYENASDEQLAQTPFIEQYIVDHYDAVIMVRGEANTRAQTGVDPHRLMLTRKAEAPLMQKVMQRAGQGSIGWISTIYPTHAYAQDAGMGLREYEDFLYKACMPDQDDPIGYWRKVEARQQKLVEWLHGKREIHVIGPDTDLKLSVAGRRFINDCGKSNLPAGEIYTGPVEDSAQGHVSFSYPAVYHGQEIDGLRLWFEQGQVVRVEARCGEAYVREALDHIEGARILGEFAIGTNTGITRATGQILFDEKIAGSFHLALGNSYPITGGLNRSAIHWDFICDLRSGGEIRADGDLLYRNGEFVQGL